MNRSGIRVAVVGAGGVGGYFGARLCAAGVDVSLVARGKHLEAIRSSGLRVESELGALHVRPAVATDHPADIGPVDFVLLGVKLWDLEAAVRSIAPLVGPRTSILALQNGVGKEQVVAAEFGSPPVLGALCYIAASIERPGSIRHGGTMQTLVFGELDGRLSKRGETFLAACTAAGIDAKLSADIRRALWQKFVFLVGFSGLTTMMRRPIGDIRSRAETRARLLGAMRETVMVARAEKVLLPLDFAEERLAFCDGLPAEMTSSMHQDFERGNRLELPWLSGDVVRRGELAGVATPINRMIRNRLQPYAGGGYVR